MNNRWFTFGNFDWIAAALVINYFLNELIVAQWIDNFSCFLILRFDQPTVIQRNVEQIENNTFGRIFELGNTKNKVNFRFKDVPTISFVTLKVLPGKFYIYI